MGRLLYVLCKLCSNSSILLLERLCIGIACYPFCSNRMKTEKAQILKYSLSGPFYVKTVMAT